MKVVSSTSSHPSDRQLQCRLHVDKNFAVAWSSITIGAVTGLILSLWSFDGPMPVPSSIGEYNDLSRRLMRLGHIAFFGLGMLNIMLARHLATQNLDTSVTKLALGSMNFGNVFLPLTLVAASFFTPLKYAASLPAMAVTIAVAIGAYAAVSALAESEGKQ